MRITRIAIAAALTATGTLTAAVPGAATGGTVPIAAARPGQLRCLTLYAPQIAVNRAIAEKAAGLRVPPGSTTPRGVGRQGHRVGVQAAPHQGQGPDDRNSGRVQHPAPGV